MRGRRALIFGLVCLGSATAVRAQDAASDWKTAFPTAAAPSHVHFRAVYRDSFDRAHELEMWRQADLRLRRRTDDSLDLYVEKSASGEYEYRLVDHHRNILIRADRTALYRIGVFSDWIGLAHVLKVPRGEYRITPSVRQSQASLRGQCVWRRLELTLPSPAATEICWSPRWGLPLEIGIDGKDGFRSHFSVEEVGTFSNGPEIFAIARDGLIEIDAGPDAEISD